MKQSDKAPFLEREAGAYCFIQGDLKKGLAGITKNLGFQVVRVLHRWGSGITGMAMGD
jgi:hypothetical protein